jgi:hypothetical protein
MRSQHRGTQNPVNTESSSDGPIDELPEEKNKKIIKRNLIVSRWLDFFFVWVKSKIHLLSIE